MSSVNLKYPTTPRANRTDEVGRKPWSGNEECIKLSWAEEGNDLGNECKPLTSKDFHDAIYCEMAFNANVLGEPCWFHSSRSQISWLHWFAVKTTVFRSRSTNRPSKQSWSSVIFQYCSGTLKLFDVSVPTVYSWLRLRYKSIRLSYLNKLISSVGRKNCCNGQRMNNLRRATRNLF